MRPTMNDSNNCDNCRFRENRSNISSPCDKCSTSLCVDPFTHKKSFSTPSEWMPLTKAQLLERNLEEELRAENTLLTGSLKNGYRYNISGKEYNKMYKEKTPRQKALIFVKKVIFNPPYTIVFWDDEIKTIVKCGENEQYDPEKGLAMAMAKRLFGNHGYYYDVFKKWLLKDKPLALEKKLVLGIDLSPETRPRTYSVKEFAMKLGVSEDTVRRNIKNGKFPGAKKENGKWAIPTPVFCRGNVLDGRNMDGCL